MKTTIRQFVPAVSLIVCLPLLAQPPEPMHGRIAILENDRLLEGDIERIGDQYRIRRAIGETWLPADRVRRLCKSLEEAHAWFRQQTNLDDPDERLRLARWCLLQGLRSQALAEVTAAVELRPGHRESLRLLRSLQQSQSAVPAGSFPEKDEPEPPSPPTLPYNPDSIGLFVSRVQPILMNTCASCHTGGRGGRFNLQRGYDQGAVINRKTTQYNLMAALAQVNRERPHESPLLQYAVIAHGGSDLPPLKGRNLVPFRALEEWVRLAVQDTPRSAIAQNPVPVPARTFPETPAIAATRSATAPAGNPNAGIPQLREGSDQEMNPERIGSPGSGVRNTFAEPERLPELPATEPTLEEPDDPFDPMIFNRQMHSPR